MKGCGENIHTYEGIVKCGTGKLNNFLGEHNIEVAYCEKCNAKLIEQKRIIKIIKSHIGNTYPINCNGIIEEIVSHKCTKTQEVGE